MPSSADRRRSPRKRGRGAAPAPRTVNPSKARRTRAGKTPSSQPNAANSENGGQQLAASSNPDPRVSEERGMPNAYLGLPQHPGPSNERDQQGGVEVQRPGHQAHPNTFNPSSQQAPFPPRHDSQNPGVAFHAGPDAAHYVAHDSQHPYQPPFHRHQVHHMSTEFSHPQIIPAHGAWPGYPYGYGHSYAPPHSGYPSQYNQAPPQPAPPSAHFAVVPARSNGAPQTQLPPRLPDAQFGVDPARLAAPPSFPQTPSSKHTATFTGPGPSPIPPSGTPLSQQTSTLGSQEVQPIVVTPPSAPSIQHPLSDRAPLPPPPTTNPVSATGEPLIIQQPPSVQNTSNQAAMTSTGQQELAVVTGQVEEDEEDEDEDDGRGADDGHEPQTRTASTRRFQGTGKTAKSQLKGKWDAEARAKGYNPDKAASGANPWAGYVEGVGVGHEEDPRAFYRRNYLYPPISTQSENTRTYNRWMGDMMTKVEDVSRRTGCVLYIIAHHPNSGKPYTWYASPKLRRKAPEALSEFHGLAAQAIVDINNAETGTKMGLVGELNRTKAQHKAVLDDLNDAQATIQELRGRLQQQDQQQTEVTITQQSTLTLGRLQGL